MYFSKETGSEGKQQSTMQQPHANSKQMGILNTVVSI